MGAQISPDKKKSGFTPSFSGTNEVWISDIDRINLLQLTSLGGPHAGSPRWSPDGKWIAFDVDAAIRGKVFIVSVNGGSAREIAPDSNSQNLVPNWSRHGKWVYFASDRSGEWQLWKAPFIAGGLVQVTHRGVFLPLNHPIVRMCITRNIGTRVRTSGAYQLREAPRNLFHRSSARTPGQNGPRWPPVLTSWGEIS